MSQQQTVRITTTETSHSSALIINTGYLATPPGILKVLQFLLGIVCVGIITANFNEHGIAEWAEIFFYLITVTFLICTTILLISCLISWSTGGIISKTIYELIYHFVGCILLLIASIAFLVFLFNKNNNSVIDRFEGQKKALIGAAIAGLINAILYGISTFYARRSYKGI